MTELADKRRRRAQVVKNRQSTRVTLTFRFTEDYRVFLKHMRVSERLKAWSKELDLADDENDPVD